jgi:hypothetical protein
MRRSLTGFTCLVVCGLLLACVDEKPGTGDPGNSGRLSIALSTSSVHDVSMVEFRILPADPMATDLPTIERRVPLQSEPRSGAADPPDAGAAHPFANALFVLPPGDYRIYAQPLQSDSMLSADCRSVQTTAHVFPRVTSEVTLVSQCKGDPKGGLGVTTILNDPPHIDDLTIEPNYPTACDKPKLTVTAHDPNGDAISYAWQLTLGNGLLSPATNTATLEPNGAGDYEVHVAATDTHDATTALAVPLHVSPGACGADGGTATDGAPEDAAPGDGGTDAAGDAAPPAPERWLTYLVEGASALDELWAAPINKGVPGTPIRVNAPLAPGQEISWTGWGGDGRRLAYRTGTNDLFIVDMTGPAPGTPRVLANVPSFSWSPNGRYLARVEQNPTTSTFKVAVVDLSDPGLVWRYSPDESYDDIRNFSWSADSEWVFGFVRDLAIWNVRVTAAGPEAISRTYTSLEEPEGFWPSPVGADYAVLMHHVLSGGRYAVAKGNPNQYAFSDVTEAWGSYPGAPIHTEFLGFMPSGEIAYWGETPGVDLSTVCDAYGYSWWCRLHVYNDCGHLRVFAVTSTPPGYYWGTDWRAGPDGRSIAVSGMLYNPATDRAEPVFHLWKRDAATCWAPAIEVDLAAPPPEGSYDIVELDTTADWAPNSRTLLIKHSFYPDPTAYALIDTQGAPPFSPTELTLHDSASGIRWAKSSLRLFYDMTLPNALGYVDLRTGIQTVPATVSPAFAHAAGDKIEWALSAGDDYVAMRSDFSQDGRYELYITDLRGVTPHEPIGVHAPLGDAQAVSTFAWQPAVGGP